MLKLASRLDGVVESATLKLNATVTAMKARGEDVVNLTTGEPDFPVPEAAKAAVRKALDENRSKYTAAPGIPELRQAIAEKTNRQQPSLQTPWKGTDVVVTNGGKQAIFNAMQALINPGDEVIIPSPYWLSYPDMAKLAGGVPKFVTASREQGFLITPAQLRSALTPRTRMVIFNSPSNPTGAMYSREQFAALGEVLRAAPDVWVLSDEIYDRVVLGKVQFCSFLEAAPWLRDRSITVNGMSKSGSMTGWRVGWSVAPSLLTQGMITLQGQSTSNINALAQYGSLATLALPESEFASQVESYKRRARACMEILEKSSKLDVIHPDGAFYLFIGLKSGAAGAGQGRDSFAFAEKLLETGKVAVVPGTPFGDEHSFRISFATEEKALYEGCRRIVEFVGS